VENIHNPYIPTRTSGKRTPFLSVRTKKRGF
jgi:hypothetical protein